MISNIPMSAQVKFFMGIDIARLYCKITPNVNQSQPVQCNRFRMVTLPQHDKEKAERRFLLQRTLYSLTLHAIG